MNSKLVFRFLMAIAAIFAFASMAFGQTELTSIRGFRNEATGQQLRTILTTDAATRYPLEFMATTGQDRDEQLVMKGQIVEFNKVYVVLDGQDAFKIMLTVADIKSKHNVYLTAIVPKEKSESSKEMIGQHWNHLVIDYNPFVDGAQTYAPTK